MQHTTPPCRTILRLPAVLAKTGLGRDTVYRLARLGQFPLRVKLTERTSGWFADEIDRWLEDRAAQRNAPSAE